MAQKYGEDHHRYGVTLSEDTRQKMREAWARRKEAQAAAIEGQNTMSMSPLDGLTSDDISARWLAFKNGTGPYPFKATDTQAEDIESDA